MDKSTKEYIMGALVVVLAAISILASIVYSINYVY